MEYIGVGILSVVAFILVVCGSAIVHQPQMLSNYNSFTEEEKNSPAFQLYLKKIRLWMYIAAFCMVLGGLLNAWTGALLAQLVTFGPVLVLPFSLFYYQSKISPRMRRKSRIYTGVTAVLLLGLVIFPLVRSVNSSVGYTNETLTVTGVYGTDIPLREIRSAQLETALPAISIRTNGMAFGEIRKGYFKTADGSIIRLYLCSREAPFLHLVTIEGEEVYLNMRDEAELRRGFRLLLQGLAERKAD